MLGLENLKTTLQQHDDEFATEMQEQRQLGELEFTNLGRIEYMFSYLFSIKKTLVSDLKNIKIRKHYSQIKKILSINIQSLVIEF